MLIDIHNFLVAMKGKMPEFIRVVAIDIIDFLAGVA